MFEKKQIFKLHALKKLLSDEKNCVYLVSNIRLLALPPFFLNDMKSGILYILNSMLKKYDRSLGGIVIGYQNIKVLMDANTGIIPIGTSEMEVNISVEFYIFQPKIGSLLEGVVNKKSNNHIGCLVHRYFNATILKPEETDFNDWICKDFDVGDKVTFKVKDLDFTSLLPNIEGVVLDEDLLHKGSVKSDNSSDNSDATKSIDAVLSKTTNEHSDDEFNFKTKKENKEEVTGSTAVVERSTKESSPLLEIKKYKKKKKKEVSSPVGSESEQEENLSSRESLRGLSVSMESEKCPEENKKKKKKKKEKKEMNQEGIYSAICVEKEEAKTEVNLERFGGVLEDYIGEVENENLSDSMTTVKLKKEKKKKKNDVESESKSFQCLTPKEDSMFSSTQLGMDSEPRMRIPFCSPIARGVPLEVEGEGESEVRVHKGSASEIIDERKEKKKKHKKRKREEEDESGVPSKKRKTWSGSLVSREGLGSEGLLEALYKDEVSRVMEEQSFKGKKNKRAKVMKKEGENGVSEVAVDEGKRTPVEGVEGSSSSHRKHQPGGNRRKESNGFSEKVNVDESEGGRKRSSKGRKGTANEVNCSAKGYGMVEMQGKQSALNEGVGHVKDKSSDKITRKREKKSKTVDSLYEKLLQEAKSAVDLVGDKAAKEQEQMPYQKDSELSDFSSSSRKTDSRKRSKHKEKVKDNAEACVRYKNGSMYDVFCSPIKFDADKSLFTDSDQSQASPTKKRKELNGCEATLEGKHKVQKVENKFFRKGPTELRSESDKASPEITLKNEKPKEKRKVSNKKSESLFEKLLKQAKDSIDFKGNSPSKK